MIVEVKAPLFSSSYEFDLSEEVLICDIQNEIMETISQKMHMENEADMKTVLLHMQSKSILNNYQTLIQAGVKKGDTLIIV